jgi:hypothetical protein
MLAHVAVILSAAAGPFPAQVWDIVPGDGGYCLATGYCTGPGSGEHARPPSGPLFLSLGLVGAGASVLRRERSGRPRRP